jgi:hypothetical protein
MYRTLRLYFPAPFVVDTTGQNKAEGATHRLTAPHGLTGSEISAMDEASSWDNLHEQFEVKRINHQEAYSKNNACTNWAEEFFSRMCRAEISIHHHIAGASLLRYAQDSSWREGNRRLSNGEQNQPPRGFVFETWQVS